MLSIQETSGFSFIPIARLGYIKPSTTLQGQCLIQLPYGYFYRNCDQALEGPVVTSDKDKKLYFWTRANQYETAYYYESDFPSSTRNVTRIIAMTNVPKDQDIHIFHILGNPFIVMILDPSSKNLYSFFLLPEKKSQISGIEVTVPYRLGQIFGIDYSGIVYVWTKTIDQQLHFIYIDTQCE